MKEKQSLNPEKSSAAKRAASSGQTAPKPITTYVEKIWSEEYCRQHPQNASQAIETLQMLLDNIEKELKNIRNKI